MSSKYKQGDKVKMSKAAAAWILEHPEAWQCPRTGELDGYDGYALDAMATLLEEPPVGVVGAHGAECGTYFVKYKNHEAVYTAYKDFYSATHVEIDVELSPKTAKHLSKLAKAANTTPGIAAAVLICAKTLSLSRLL